MLALRLVAARVVGFFRERIEGENDPRSIGTALREKLNAGTCSRRMEACLLPL